MYGSHQILWVAMLVSAPCMTAFCHSQEHQGTQPSKNRWVTSIPPTPLSTADGLPLPLTAAWGYTPIEESGGVTETFIDPPPVSSTPSSACTAASIACSACVAPAAGKTGCAKFFDLQKHYRHPSTFRPLGDAVNSTFSTQVQNGDAARTTLYQYDFFRGNASLNQRGYLELLEIAQRISRTPYPLVIQTSGDAELDAARRATVIDHLEKLPLGIAEERVLIDIPSVYGLDGIDAVLAHDRLLRPSPYGRGNSGGGSSVAAPFLLPSGQ